MLVLTPFLKIYLGALCFLLGSVMGSFLNCAALRRRSGESIVRGRSHCAVCGHVLGAADLVPLWSWFFLRGKCRYCGGRVAARYPLTELVCALGYLSFFLRFGLTLRTLEMLILFSLLLCLALIDLDTYLLPDSLIAAGLVCRVVFILLSGDIGKMALRSLLGGVSVSLPLLLIVLIAEKLLKKEAMGGGDIKLLFMTGSYFFWYENLFGFLISCFAGIVMGLVAQRRSRSGESRPIPFGPAIALGVWVSALFGQQAVFAYLSLF